ncbi:hypothetical protein SAMN02745194_02271 [Roseomonas rosea]|uniref:Uncharacterized protein n=1 Tax=Muricoccus roseus TaxID=198092 RepID=A0A1M6I905_9PROT|nr:hypothetical protein SAMN02745194_02271 [Roseomonas rosea]
MRLCGRVYPALEQKDALACAIARLLLYTDLAALLGVDQPNVGWAYYLPIRPPSRGHLRNEGEVVAASRTISATMTS